MRNYLIILFSLLTASLFCSYNSPHRLFIGSDLLYYGEFNQYKYTYSLSDKKGFLKGIDAGYDYVYPNSLYFGGDIYYNHLKVMDKTPWFTDNSKEKISNYEGRLGFSLALQKTTIIVLFATLGKHYLNKKWHDFEFDRISYDWQYFGGGGRIYFLMSPLWKFCVFVKASKITNGTIKISQKTDLFNTVDEITGSVAITHIGKNWFYSIELPNYFYLPYLSPFDLSIIPYYHSFDTKTGKNLDTFSNKVKYHSYGLQVELGLSF